MRTRIIGLMRLVGARKRGTDELSDLRKEAKKLGAISTDAFKKEYGGYVFVITQMGLVPRKEAEYIPIITARRYSNYHGQITGINGINFPVLQASFAATSRGVITVDGRDVVGVTDFNIAGAVRAGWFEIVPKMMTAAIVRAVARAAIGTTARAATDGKKSEGWGALIALVLTGTLTAQDRPDTRSWTTLPAHISISGYKLEPGRHSVAVTLNGRTETQPVTIDPGKIHVLNFSKNR